LGREQRRVLRVRPREGNSVTSDRRRIDPGVSIFKRHQTRKGDEGAEKEVVELLVSLEVMGFTGNHSKRLNIA
jgi:hypothetical protein